MFIQVTSKKYSESYIKLVEGLSDGMRDLIGKINADNQPAGEVGFYYSRGFNGEDSLNPVQFAVCKERYGEIAGIDIPKSKWRREKQLRKITYNDMRELFTRDSDDELPLSEVRAIRKRCDKTFLIKSYGVADSVQQIKQTYKFLDKSDRQFVCFITPIYREHQSDSGGFRFHKFGPYIGRHNITCEYLYDQTDIDVVYVYHFHEIINQKPDYSTDRFHFKMTHHSHGVVINTDNEIVANIGFTKDEESGKRTCYVGHWSNYLFTVPQHITKLDDIFDYIGNHL